MGKSAEAPSAPNYSGLQAQQAGINARQFQTQLRASRTNTRGPYGSVTWERSPWPTEKDGLTTIPGSPGSTPSPVAGPPIRVPRNPMYKTGLAGSPILQDDGGYDPSRPFGPAGPQVPPPGTPAQPGDTPYVQPPTNDPYSGYVPPDEQWTQVTQLSPEQQRLYNANVASQEQQSKLLQGAAGRVGSTLEKGIDSSSLPAWATGLARGDNSQRSQSVADALVSRYQRYQQPQFDRQKQSLRDDLISQGFASDSEGYKRRMGDLDQQQSLAFGDVMDRAIGASGAEDSRLFQQGLAADNFTNSTRNQMFQQILQERALPLNELNQLRAGTQSQAPYQTPGSTATPNLSNMGQDLIGNAQASYGQRLGAYNAGVAADNQNMNALLGMLAMYAASDRSLKTNIELAGKTSSGANIYRYTYLNGAHSIGVMADEVPHASKVTSSGYLAVDYRKV